MKNRFFVLFLLFLVASCSIPKHEPADVRVEKLMQTTQSWNGDELPVYPDGKPEISILKVIIPPHSKLALHKHPVINAGILLTGELTVITEKNDTLFMKAGDPISEVVETWHYGVNEGDETAEIVVFYAGVLGTPLSVHAEEENER